MEKRIQHEQLAGAFRLAPDLGYRYRHPSYEDGLQRLEKSLTYGPGIVLMSGGPGTGKTMLFKDFIGRERPDYLLSFQLVGGVEQEDLVQMLAGALQIDESQYDYDGLKAQIRERIRLQRYVGRRVLIAIDEAHNFSIRALAFLSALATQHLIWPGSIVIVLFGAEKLEQMLAYDDIAAAGGRIIAKHRLMPMDGEHTRAYIEHRLRVAGVDWFRFRDAALERIYEQSGGVPRRINQLCGRGITYALIDSRDYVDAADIVSQSDEVSPAVLDHYLKDSKRASAASATRLKDLKDKVASSLSPSRTERNKIQDLDVELPEVDNERPIYVEANESAHAQRRQARYHGTRKRIFEMGLLGVIVAFFAYFLFIDPSYQHRASDWLTARIGDIYREPVSDQAPASIDSAAERQVASAIQPDQTALEGASIDQDPHVMGRQLSAAEPELTESGSERLLDPGETAKGNRSGEAGIDSEIDSGIDAGIDAGGDNGAESVDTPQALPADTMQAVPAKDRILLEGQQADDLTALSEAEQAHAANEDKSTRVDSAPSTQLSLPSPLGPSATASVEPEQTQNSATASAEHSRSPETQTGTGQRGNEQIAQTTDTRSAKVAIPSHLDPGVVRTNGKWVISPDLERALKQQAVRVQRLEDGRLRLLLDAAEVPLLAGPASARPVTDLDKIAFVLRNFHGFDTAIISLDQPHQAQLISDFLVQQGMARTQVRVQSYGVPHSRATESTPTLLLTPAQP